MNADGAQALRLTEVLPAPSPGQQQPLLGKDFESWRERFEDLECARTILWQRYSEVTKEWQQAGAQSFDVLAQGAGMYWRLFAAADREWKSSQGLGHE